MVHSPRVDNPLIFIMMAITIENLSTVTWCHRNGGIYHRDKWELRFCRDCCGSINAFIRCCVALFLPSLQFMPPFRVPVLLEACLTGVFGVSTVCTFSPIERSLWFRGWVMLSHYQHWWLAKSLAFDDHNSTTSYGFCPCCHHCLSSILSSDTSISPLNCRKQF